MSSSPSSVGPLGVAEASCTAGEGWPLVCMAACSAAASSRLATVEARAWGAPEFVVVVGSCLVSHCGEGRAALGKSCRLLLR